jgi:excisionase family DNA binding protein
MAAKTLIPAELADRVFLTPTEVADVLQWDLRTVRRLIHNSTIPATEGGGNSYRIAAQWVREQAAIDGRPGQLESIEARLAEVEAKLARLAGAFGGAA